MVEISKPENAKHGAYYSNYKGHAWWPKLVLFVIILIIIAAGALVLSHKLTTKKKVIPKTIDGIPVSQINTNDHLGNPMFVAKQEQAK
jgi:hypothetical protein